MSFTCTFCKVSYDKKSHLSKHIMDEHISKGNYSTEVNKYNTVKEKVVKEKERKISSPNRKKCEVEEKVMNKTQAVEIETHLETVDKGKGYHICYFQKDGFGSLISRLSKFL